MPEDCMNIVYINSHDTGRYIQPYGHQIATPNLQRLAEEGVLFRKAFCAGPTCSPSRACLLTGQSAHSNGMLGLAHRGWRLNDYRQHIVNTLNAAGYTSALAGVQHVAKEPYAKPEEIGHHEIINRKGGVAQVVPDVEAYLKRRHEKPFFLEVGFGETHRAFPEPQVEDNPAYTLPPAPLPDTPEMRKDMAAYKTCARRLDEGVGRVLKALEENGLSENTLVICTTDHGIAFPFMKCNLTDNGIGVMLLMRGPGGFSGGKVVDGMVSHIDLFPTICALLDINPPDWLQGKSILPLVRGEADEVNEEIFAEVTYHASYEPKRAVRTRRWKYIRRFDHRSRPVLPNCDDGFSKRELLGYGWRDRPVSDECLFDLIFDPNESCNLADDPRHAEIKAEMRSRLNAWMERTEDPLLIDGYVPLAPGGKTNDPNGLNPKEPVMTQQEKV